MDQIGVNIGICLGNSHDNFQLHKREYSKSFRGGYFFDSHCTSSLWSSVQLSYLVLVLLWIIIILVTFTKGLCSTEHLDVCPLATSCKNYWSDGSSQRDESVDKEELIKFWKSSTSGFGSRNYPLNFGSHLVPDLEQISLDRGSALSRCSCSKCTD